MGINTWKKTGIHAWKYGNLHSEKYRNSQAEKWEFSPGNGKKNPWELWEFPPKNGNKHLDIGIPRKIPILRIPRGENSEGEKIPRRENP